MAPEGHENNNRSIYYSYGLLMAYNELIKNLYVHQVNWIVCTSLIICFTITSTFINALLVLHELGLVYIKRNHLNWSKIVKIIVIMIILIIMFIIIAIKLLLLFFIKPPRNRGGVIFLLQFVSVCLSVCLSVCVSGILVNKIPAERMYQFGRGFR